MEVGAVFLAGCGGGSRFGRGGGFFGRSFVAAGSFNFFERRAHVAGNGATGDFDRHDGSRAFKKGHDEHTQHVEIGVLVIRKFDHVGCDRTDQAVAEEDAEESFKVDGQRNVEARAADVACAIDFLAPEGLKFTQTDQYDPNPEPQITLREWHLTASTPAKAKSIEFVTLYRPHRNTQAVTSPATIKAVRGGYILTAGVADGRVLALLPNDDATTLAAEDLATQGKVLVQRDRADGSAVATMKVAQ